MNLKNMSKVLLLYLVADVFASSIGSMAPLDISQQSVILGLGIVNSTSIGPISDMVYIVIYTLELMLLYYAFNRSKSYYIIQKNTYKKFYENIVINDIIEFSFFISLIAFICNIIININYVGLENFISLNLLEILFINFFINFLYFILLLQIYEGMKIKFNNKTSLLFIFVFFFLIFYLKQMDILSYSLTNIINILLFNNNYFSSLYYVFFLSFMNFAFYTLNIIYGYKKEFYE